MAMIVHVHKVAELNLAISLSSSKDSELYLIGSFGWRHGQARSRPRNDLVDSSF